MLALASFAAIMEHLFRLVSLPGPAAREGDQLVWLLLLDNGGNSAGTHGAAAFTDSEAQTSLDGDGGDQGHFHLPAGEE